MCVPLKPEAGKGLGPDPVRAWLTSTYPTCSADPVLQASPSELGTGFALLLAGKSCLNTCHCLEEPRGHRQGPRRDYLQPWALLPPPEPLVTFYLENSPHSLVQLNHTLAGIRFHQFNSVQSLSHV